MSTNASEEVKLDKESPSFHWKPVAAVFMIIIASSLVFYGYQRFQQREAQEQKALLDAVQRAGIAQRKADEATKRTLEIQAQLLKQEIELENMQDALTQEKIQFAKKKRRGIKTDQVLAKPKKAKAFDDAMELWRNTGGIPRDLRR